MAKYAAIDCGTNAIKFHIAEKNSDGQWTAILDNAEVTRLGEGLHKTGQITEPAMARSLNAIGAMVEMARQAGVDEIIAIGTMALRTATNAKNFIGRVKNEHGITVEIISGEEEARLSFLAVTSSLDVTGDRFLIFDIGGGSTEFIWGTKNQIDQRISLNLGVVRLTEDILKSDPVTENECETTSAVIERAFDDLFALNTIKMLIGVGATLTTLGAMKMKMAVYGREMVHGSMLAFAEVDGLVSLLKSKTISERKKIVGLEPRRADVILAGALIVKTIMTKFGTDFVTISDHGVRHGLLIDRFGIRKQ